METSRFQAPSLSRDKRSILVDELWEAIKPILESAELDPSEKNELILDWERYYRLRRAAAPVSLRLLSASGNSLSASGDFQTSIENPLTLYHE